jgi:hypothetical protein
MIYRIALEVEPEAVVAEKIREWHGLVLAGIQRRYVCSEPA